MQRFECNVKDDTYHIKWNNIPIPKHIYIYIKKIMNVSTDYAVMGSVNKDRLHYELHEINDYYQSRITMEQYLSMRNTLLKQKCIKMHHDIVKFVDDVTYEYDTGKNIINLSKRYDYPPINLLKAIFINQGYDKKSINKVFRLQCKPDDVLLQHDCKQFNLAEKCDVDSMTQQLRYAQVAADNEMLLIDFFKKLGIKLSTQEDLVEEQTKMHGRAVMTPDILFRDTVFINGVRVHWIEYKDYACTDAHYLLLRNIEQVKKYTKTWGTGAICYNHSYVSSIIIPETLILDATALKIKFTK